MSRICAGLDERVAAFRARSLRHVGFVYVFLDATYIHVREDALGQVVSRAVVVATAVSAAGGREVIGVDIGDSEDETFWTGFLRSLKARRLAGAPGGSPPCSECPTLSRSLVRQGFIEAARGGPGILGDMKPVLTFEELAESVRTAPPRTADDVSITLDGRRLDSKEKVMAFLAEVEAERLAERRVADQLP